MKKITASLLSALTIAAVSMVAGFFAPKIMPQITSKTVSTVTAKADSPQTGITFTNPSDVASANGYTAVADQRQVYLFNHANGGVWQEYSHPHAVTKIQFHGDELYFLDEQSQLYRLNAAALEDSTTAEKTEIVCSTFTLHENTLYYANVSAGQTAIRQASLTDLTAQAEPFTVKGYFPTLSYYNQTLYALGGGTLQRFSLANKESTQVATLPNGTNALTVFAGQVLGTADGRFFSYDLAELSEKQSADNCTPLLSEVGAYTALSASEQGVYLLNGNSVKVYDLAHRSWKTTTEFSQPSAKAIPTKRLISTVNAPTATPLQLVTTVPRALLVKVDFHAAEDEGLFPCKGTVRKESFTAILLGKSDGYALLAHRENAASDYETYILSERSITENTDSLFSYETPQTGYLTNAVGLYKYPVLTLPQLSRLERGATLLLSGEVTLAGETYYQVMQEGQTGYIPKSYVTLHNAATPDTQTQTVGEAENNADGIWRLVYILLGVAAIGILTDFLILRKHPEREE